MLFIAGLQFVSIGTWFYRLERSTHCRFCFLIGVMIIIAFVFWFIRSNVRFFVFFNLVWYLRFLQILMLVHVPAVSDRGLFFMDASILIGCLIRRGSVTSYSSLGERTEPHFDKSSWHISPSAIKCWSCSIVLVCKQTRLKQAINIYRISFCC